MMVDLLLAKNPIISGESLSIRCNCFAIGGLQFGSTAFESRLSYGGGGGGGGGSAMSDDRNPGGRGGNGGGLVYLQIDELSLNGKILAGGEIIFKIPVYMVVCIGVWPLTKDHSL